MFFGGAGAPRHRYANFKSIKSMLRAIFASRVAPAMENAGGTESVDKYRTARRTFESRGELGAFFCAASRGATRRAAVPPRSIRLERNPKTLTYSPGTMRRRRAPHSQRGGRRPRGDVSPTGRVFHTARSIKVGASQPSNRRPCHRIRRNLYEAVATRRTHSHAVIRQKFISTTAAVPRRRPRARTRRPRRAGVDGISRGGGGLFGHGVRRRGALAPAVGSEIWYWSRTRP